MVGIYTRTGNWRVQALANDHSIFIKQHPDSYPPLDPSSTSAKRVRCCRFFLLILVPIALRSLPQSSSFANTHIKLYYVCALRQRAATNVQHLIYFVYIRDANCCATTMCTKPCELPCERKKEYAEFSHRRAFAVFGKSN